MTRLTHSHSALKLYDNCPKNYFHQRVEKSVRDEGNAVTAYGERIHKALEDRLAKGEPLSREASRYEALCARLETLAESAGTLTVEEEMTLNADLEPTGWWDDDAWLRSKLDVLIQGGTKAHVYDWKTGKRRPDFDQLELFALQVFKHYPEIQRVKTVFVWLKEMKVDSEDYSRSDVPALLEKVLTKVSRIEASLEHGNWPAKPSGLCNWCPCRSFCEFAK
jgi:hypothetical protein